MHQDEEGELWRTSAQKRHLRTTLVNPGRTRILVRQRVTGSRLDRIKTFEGSSDDQGVCHCSVVLPDSTFPADRLEILEISHRNLSIKVEQQITKIQHYERTLAISMERLVNLTKRVEVMEMGGLSYTELDFELVKLEIRELEALILPMKSSMNGTNGQLETLHQEIRNISSLVNQMEVYDKNNVVGIRREIAALQKQLKECQKNQNHSNPSLPPVNIGQCDHGEIVNISKPFVVQLNWLGANYKYGACGRDSMLGADQNLQWVAPLLTDGRIMSTVRFYTSYNDLLVYNSREEKVLSVPIWGGTDYKNCGQGGGAIVFNNSLYYNCYNSQSLCKLNIETKEMQRAPLTDASYNNRFSYSSSAWQDIDFASDEVDLWVIYTTEADNGNIRIGKVNPSSLALMQTWTTTQFKRGITNAFMACGVLYATRSRSTKSEEIFYMYDTKTNKEASLSVALDKMMENVQSLSYNPNDHKLYVYNDGYLVTYDLTFKQLEKRFK
ncbi:hypothetical protein GDO81_029584 [Engystomops pustulosus]|uniref:Olfactomedin-like domain-containing protein n=1 Tax=Engystomops pustulosus TaxID=76066 RepID=A0AAV6ZBQ2_ENGPU|nr:hypothetical protein GDO81_029584 [Engystomops pustulosus]